MPDRRQPPRLVSRAVDFRAADDTEPGDGRTLDGYAAVFDTPTEINSWEGAFTEKLAFGAFRKTLRERTPVLQFDHGRDAQTGSVPIGASQPSKKTTRVFTLSPGSLNTPWSNPIPRAIEGKGDPGACPFPFQDLSRTEGGEPPKTGKKN